MSSHFNVLATSSTQVWERLLAAEDRLRIEKGWAPRESDPEMADPFSPWDDLVHRGCRSALGDYCLEERVRATRLDTLLLEGEWFAWAPCYAQGDVFTSAFIVERRAGEIVESRARLGRGFLLRKDPYLLLEINGLLGIPVRQCAP